MSYYEPNTPSWPNARPGWERAAPAQLKSEDPAAFGAQLDEVDRAVDNLVKSGKMFAPPRRESMPVLGPRAYPPEHDSRMAPQVPSRHYSVQDFDAMRTQPAASLQNFYAAQRFQPRPSEAEQMMQAKRRLAAQRERDLRNYHQEQQFNRTILAEISSFGKERIVSPGAMTEEERRELIARQHRALYGADGSHIDDGVSVDENGTPRQSNQVSNGASNTSNAGTRGASPMSFDPFGMQGQNPNGNIDGSQQHQSGEHQTAATASNSPTRSRTNSASSPSSKSASFSLFESTNPQGQSSRTSASSPGGSPPRPQNSRNQNAGMNGGVAPIGTRPSSQAQASNPALTNKRSTTPLPSPLSYGFGNEDPFHGMPKERSASAASNNSSSNPQDWGKVWGGKGLGSVASVWG